MKYRVAKAKNNNAIVAVEEDSGQNGDYEKTGVWCDWTFPVLPVSLQDMTNPSIIWITDDGKGFDRTVHAFGWRQR